MPDTLRLPVLAVAIVAASICILAAVALMAGMMSGMGHHRGSRVASSPTVVTQTGVGVEISDFAFVPSNVSVPLGASVSWTNRDGAPHDATADSDDWGTETLKKGDKDTVEFTEPGTFEYYCSIHPYMRGILTVRPAD